MPSGSPSSVDVGRRVVQEHDAQRAVRRSRCSPRVERVDVGRSRRRPPQQRLAEVGQVRAGEAADEALRAGDADLDAADLAGSPVALEHRDARRPRSRRRARRAGPRASRGCRARRRPACRARGTHRRAPRPARARRAWSGRPRAGGGRLRRPARRTRLERRRGWPRGSARRRRRRCGSRRPTSVPWPISPRESGVAAPAWRELRASSIETMRRRPPRLREAEVPFMLAGSMAAGRAAGRESGDDVDFMVRAGGRRPRAARCSRGRLPRRATRPRTGCSRPGTATSSSTSSSEPAGLRSTTRDFARADELEVCVGRMQVHGGRGHPGHQAAGARRARPRLRRASSRSPARCASRSTGTSVRERTAGSPYARAFFFLAEELGVVERP